MSTPVFVSPQGGSQQISADSRSGAQNTYHFHAQGVDWCVLVRGGFNAQPSGIVVVKSVDGGNTWTEMDSAHEPIPNGAATYQNGTNLYVSIQASVNTISLYAFNLVTGVWTGLLGTSPALAVNIGSNSTGVHVTSGGTFYFVWTDTSNNLKFITFNGVSTWGTETTILSGVPYLDQYIPNPADDSMILIVNTVSSSNVSTWRALRISSAGSLTNNFLFPDNIVGFSTGNGGGANGIITTSGVSVAAIKQSSGSNGDVVIYRGSPANNPTWAAAQVINSARLFPNEPTLALNASGNETCYWFSFDDLQNNNNANTTIRMSTYNGTTWSAVALIIDMVATPYPVPPGASLPNTSDMLCIGVEHFSGSDYIHFDGSFQSPLMGGAIFNYNFPIAMVTNPGIWID